MTRAPIDKCVHCGEPEAAHHEFEANVLADIIDFCVAEDVTAMPSDEIRAELDAAGIDTDRMVQWVRTTLARAKEKPDAK